jgi:hypothetical protein
MSRGRRSAGARSLSRSERLTSGDGVHALSGKPWRRLALVRSAPFARGSVRWFASINLRSRCATAPDRASGKPRTSASRSRSTSPSAAPSASRTTEILRSFSHSAPPARSSLRARSRCRSTTSNRSTRNSRIEVCTSKERLRSSSWGYGAELRDPVGYLIYLWDERSMRENEGSEVPTGVGKCRSIDSNK